MRDDCPDKCGPVSSGRTALAALLLLVPALAVGELVVSGVGDAIERNVRAYVSLAEEPCNAEAWRIRRRFRTLEQETRKALEPFGYYDPAITATLNMGGDCWKASVDIQRGQPVRLRDVDIDILGAASTDPGFGDLLQTTTLPSGKRLRHADYDGFKRSLQMLAAERGYFDAEFRSSRIDVWPEEHAADIRIDFDSGDRYRIGEIVQEQDFLEPRLVEAFVDLEPGTPFDSRELARAHRDLSDSGYFGRVEVLPDTAGADAGTIPVRVTVDPGIRTEYTIGAGFSTDIGAQLRAGFRNNRLNNRGHRIKTDIGYSPVVEGINGEYRIPLADPRVEWLSYTGAITSEDTDTFDSDRARLGLRLSKRIARTWIRTLSADYDYERFNVGEDADSSRLLQPAIAFDHKFADLEVYPNRGRRFGIELRGAADWLGSTTTFAQIRSWARWIRAVGNGRVIVRGTAGFTYKSEFDELPPSVRFFAGGDESIRGFDYESLGPTDDEGNVIGGSHLLTGSIEYEHRLRGNIFGAAFVDAGNAFDNFNVRPEVGAGLGIKWRSPIGPVRAYVGFPVSDSDRSARFHLRLGPDL